MNEIITSLRVEDVYPNPKNNRDNIAGITELAANIKENGLLNPIRVVKDGEVYVIVAGHRRHAAIQALGWEHIDAIVNTDWDEAASVKRLVADNASTVPLTDLEKSRGIQTMLLTGVRPEAAAASSGESLDRITKATRGLAIVADQVAAEDLTLDRLIALEEFDGDHEAIERITNAPESEWRKVADNVRARRAADDAYKAAVALIEDAGLTLLTDINYGQHEYISTGNEVPAEALYGYISRWGTHADLRWYKDRAAATQTAEEAAAAEARAEAQIAMEQAAKARRAFIDGYTGFGSLFQLSRAAWEGKGQFEDDAIAADSSFLDASVMERVGLPQLVIQAVAHALEEFAAKALGLTEYHHYWATEPWLTAYFDALRDEGYQPNETEAQRMADIAALKGGNE